MCKGPERGRSLGLLRTQGPCTYVAGGQGRVPALVQARPGGGCRPLFQGRWSQWRVVSGSDRSLLPSPPLAQGPSPYPTERYFTTPLEVQLLSFHLLLRKKKRFFPTFQISALTRQREAYLVHRALPQRPDFSLCQQRPSLVVVSGQLCYLLLQAIT